MIHNDYYIDVLNTMEVLVTVLSTSTEVLAAQLSVPLEAKEAVCSICWAAPFLDNSSELMKIRAMLLNKYPKDEDLRKSTMVHKKVLLGLSQDMPDDSLIDYYLSNILSEHTTPNAQPSGNTALSKSSSSSSPSTSPSVSSSSVPRPQQPSTASLDSSNSLQTSSNQLMGSFRIDMNGHCWVLQDDGSAPIFIPKSHSLSANEGDAVLVSIDARKDNKRSGKVVRVLEPHAQPEYASTPVKQSRDVRAEIAKVYAGEARGILRIDANCNAWVVDESFPRPIYILPIALGPALEDDEVTVQVFRKGSKLIGKIASARSPAVLMEAHEELDPTPAEPSPVESSSSSRQLDPRIRPNSLLDTFPWSPISLEECSGLYKSEGEGFGMILIDDPNAAPVVILGDSHRNGAENGDSVRVNIFGETQNPSTGSTLRLGQIETIISLPSSPVPHPTKSPHRDVQLVPRDAGELVLPLELDSNGDAYMLHPTLPWTYIVIPALALGNAIAGDEIAVDLLGRKPTQGKVTGVFKGIVSTLEAYDTSAQVVLEEPSRLSVSAAAEAVHGMEQKLSDWSNFNPSLPSSSSASYPTLQRIVPSDVVVIDFGSGYIKAGHANQPVPILQVPTLCGRVLESLLPQRPSNGSSRSNSEIVVGNNAQERRSLLSISHPFSRGSVSDWPAIHSLLSSIFHNLHIDPLRAIVVMMDSEAGDWSWRREKIAEFLFHDLHVPFAYFARTGPCILLSERKKSGIVVDLGHSTACISVVEDGYEIEALRTRFPIAGCDITDRLIALLSDDGYRMWKTESQKVSADLMKQAIAHVNSNSLSLSSSGSKPVSSGNSRSYTRSPSLSGDESSQTTAYSLEDGTSILVGDRAWQCAEILFDPSIIGLDCGGLQSQIFEVMRKVRDPNSIIKDKHAVTDTIYLVGGSSLLPGLRHRLQSELKRVEQSWAQDHGHSPSPPYIEHPSKAQYSAWIGGSLLTKIADFKDCVLSKQEFEAVGPTSVGQTFI